MYLISNQERRDIIKMLTTLRETLPTGRSLRRANMVRVAGLLVESLERRTEIDRDTAKAIKQSNKTNNKKQ